MNALATQGPWLLPKVDMPGVGRSKNIDIWIVLSSEPSDDDEVDDIGEYEREGVESDGDTSPWGSTSIWDVKSKPEPGVSRPS